MHSTWINNTSSSSSSSSPATDLCMWQCKSGFSERNGGCCRSKPSQARWSLHSTCEWRCTKGLRAVGDQCVDDIVAELLVEWDVAESNQIIDRLVEEQLEELMKTTMKRPLTPTTDTTTTTKTESELEMIDHIVELELDRRRAEAINEADRADADVDAFAKYAAFDSGTNDTNNDRETNNDRKTINDTNDQVTNVDKTSDASKDTGTCSNPPPMITLTPFDITILDELEAEAKSRVEAMVDQVNPPSL